MATYQNSFLIYNPFAGKLIRKRDQLLQRTIDELRSRGHQVTAIPTRGPRTAADLARECVDQGADLILAAGGDGTINEVLNGIVHSDVPLAIVPAGTANVLAVELGIGTQMTMAARKLEDLVPARISVGLLENNQDRRHFILMAGAGFDAMILYTIDAKLKAAFGKAAYWFGGFNHFAKPLPEFDVVIDGTRSRWSFALASRVRNYGGDLWIARGASLFSDQFELVLFEGNNSLPYVKYLIGIMANRLSTMRGVSVTKAESIVLECSSDPGIYVQIDGEHAGRLPARLSIVPRSLTLLIPPALMESANTAAHESASLRRHG
ncbi:MAG TPA: diacylglycerol kinase family protein [Bryobacteraceae bacterium]|nr:diacylglycerol kinase family protein [Bryobacteraceae bacterium]